MTEAKFCRDTVEKTVAEYGAHQREVAPVFVFFASAADSSDITDEFSALLGGEARAG